MGDVSKFGRGKHTTRTVRLIPLGDGLLADSPGFNQPTLDGISSNELAFCFAEFRERLEAQPCRYHDCQHMAEPGCTISGAGFERYPLYVKFLAEIREREGFDVRGMQMDKRQREGAVKVKQERGGGRRLEARLESKKHRNVSRRRLKQDVLESLEDD